MLTRLQLYQLVTPLAGLGIWERDFKTGEHYWNRIVREIFEVPADTFMQLEDVYNCYANPAAIRQNVESAIATKTPVVAEQLIYSLTGCPKYLKVTINAAFDNNTCIGIYGTIQDISEDVSRRQQTDELNQLYSSAFNHAPIGMALVSLDGRCMKANESLCKFLGYSDIELFQKPIKDWTHPEDIGSDQSHFDKIINFGSASYSIEKRYIHKNGHYLWALLSVSVVRNSEGIAQYMIAQVKDISESRKNVEIINTKNERLIDFAYIVSHNLRSHSSNIQTLSKMLSEEELPTERGTLQQMLLTSANNLTETLDNLSEVVKINSQEFYDLEQLDLYEQIERVIAILAADIKIYAAEVTIEIARKIELNFNRSYLESILLNLLNNSLKYRHPKRQPQLHLKAFERDNHIHLLLSDNGLGIDMERYGDQIFRLYKTFHGNPDARGLGLYLVRNQIEAMGGSIRAFSIPDEGTTFELAFRKRLVGP